MRAEELTAQALAPGSPLACLDRAGGRSGRGGVRKAVFATPAKCGGSDVAYVAAQFVLLSDMSAFGKQGGAEIGADLLPLRQALEADPFGFLAHVLVRRDGCTSENCPAFAVLRDPSHVRTNIIAQTLQHYVDHYREVWAQAPDAPAVGVDRLLARPAIADPGKHKVAGQYRLSVGRVDPANQHHESGAEGHLRPLPKPRERRGEKPKDAGADRFGDRRPPPHRRRNDVGRRVCPAIHLAPLPAARSAALMRSCSAPS